VRHDHTSVSIQRCSKKCNPFIWAKLASIFVQLYKIHVHICYSHIVYLFARQASACVKPYTSSKLSAARPRRVYISNGVVKSAIRSFGQHSHPYLCSYIQSIFIYDIYILCTYVPGDLLAVLYQIRA
jgi:hypothetical protein